MTAPSPLIDLDAHRAAALVRVLEELPPELWSSGTASPEMWDRALLDPARDILSRGGKGVRGRLAEHGWALGDGARGQMPSELSITIELLHVGSLVVDDIQDDSQMRRGAPAVHQRYGMPIALNMANWLYFVAYGLVMRLPMETDRRLAMLQDVNGGLLRCHQGQALDLAVRVSTLRPSDVSEIVSTSTSLKTGSLMGLASTMGARMAGADGERLSAIETFGAELGVFLQMLDDWSSVALPYRREKGHEDLRFERLTWPWAWLAAADPGRFEVLSQRMADAATPAELDAVAVSLADELRDSAARRLDDQRARVRSRLDETGADPSAREHVDADVSALQSAFS